MWAFIEEQKDLQVATIGADGMPHLSTLWFALVDGDLVFETYRKSQKVVNLRRDPRISVLLCDGREYNELRGVTFQGRAEVIDDPDVVHRYALAVMTRNQPGVPAEQLALAAKHMAAKRSAVIVKPDKIASWDHRKLAGKY